MSSNSFVTNDTTTIRVGRDAVEVKRLAPEPVFRPALPRHEATFLRAFSRAEDAGLINEVPPEEMIRALSRAIADDPKTAVARIESGISELTTDIADVSVLRLTFSCLSVLPGDQPRGAATGGRPTQVPDPLEDLDEAADNLGLRVLTFENVKHLQDWCADAIARSLTRAKRRGRPQEIAATGTRRPISVSLVLLKFEDGTPSQWVPLVSDGISRLSVCAAGVLGVVDKAPEVAARKIAETLVAASVLNGESRSNDLVRRMQRNYQKQVERYENHVTEDGPDEVGVQIRQFLTLPADLYLLATESGTAEPHALETAMQGIVSDTHTGVDGWDPEDKSRHTIMRALAKMVEVDAISETFHSLCSGRVPAAVVDEVHEPEEGVRDDRVLLRRAVSILAVLAGQENFELLKKALREFGGHPQLTVNQVVEYIAPLVCEPWGTNKPMTKAWNYGGPVLPGLRYTDLVPVHPVDYLDLVEVAIDDDSTEEEVEAACFELALAGGTALLADGVLTTAVVGGSGGARTKLAFRGPVNAAIDALTETEEGLTLLAIGANEFNPQGRADKSRLPDVDFGKRDRIQRDGQHIPVAVTEVRIAELAAEGDPARATNGDDADEPEDDQKEQSPGDIIRALAESLPDGAHNLLKQIREVRDLSRQSNESTGLSEDDRDTIHDDLSEALKIIGRLS